ncbi:hypothetical protein ABNB80_04900 [Paenibacillus larvae]
MWQIPGLYVSAIKDLYNNEIVAYHMSLHNDNQLTHRNLKVLNNLK